MQLFPPGFTVLQSPHPHLFFFKPTKTRDSPPQSVRPPFVGIHHAGLGVSATKVRLSIVRGLAHAEKKYEQTFWWCFFLPNPCDVRNISRHKKNPKKVQHGISPPNLGGTNLRYQLRGLVVLLFIASANWRFLFPAAFGKGDVGEASHFGIWSESVRFI